MFAGVTPPSGWLLCQGQILNVSQQYQALFALIGAIYGGNGATTFALPDLRGRTPIGQGQGANLTARTIGEGGGSPAATVGLPHAHSVIASTLAATTETPGPTVVLAASGTTTTLYTKAGASGGTTVAFNQNAVATACNSREHNNVMPSLGINFMICYSGYFPPRQ